jgi:hypothetical protein
MSHKGFAMDGALVVVDSHSGEKGGTKLIHKGLPMDGWIPGHSVRKRVVHRGRSPTGVEGVKVIKSCC